MQPQRNRSLLLALVALIALLTIFQSISYSIAANPPLPLLASTQATTSAQSGGDNNASLTFSGNVPAPLNINFWLIFDHPQGL